MRTRRTENRARRRGTLRSVWAGRVLGCLALASCYHVDLRSPPAQLSPEQRVASYSELRPTRQGYLSVSTDRGKTWTLESTSIFLGGGVEIVHADDLLPVVASGSRAARAARASASARLKGHMAFAFQMVALLTGAYLIRSVFDEQPPTWPAGRTGLGLVFVGTPIGYYVQRHYLRVELRERRIAFEHYPAALADRLNVCASELAIVPCELLPERPNDPPPPADPPAAPATRYPVAVHWRMR